MFLIFTVAVLGVAVISWRNGGPMLAMAISWLVCLTPVATGMISYDYLLYSSNHYLWILALAIASFGAGAFIAGATRPAPPVRRDPHYDWDSDLARWKPVAQFCLVVSFVAIGAIIANIKELGLDFSDLSIIREGVINTESATTWARIAALTLWACFFCFAFALYFRHRLSLFQVLLYLLTGAGGIFLSTLMMAGRGSVFQVVLLTLFLEAIRARRLPAGTGRRFLWKMIILGTAAAFILYVTMARTTGIEGYNKADLFLRLFNARLNPTVDAALSAISPGGRDIVVEMLIYISHSVPLFSVFLEIDFGRHYWGLHDFPFIFRQLEPLTGMSVIEAYRIKTAYLGSQGVIGVGWITTVHTLLMDFGTFGMILFLGVQGYFSQWAWGRVRRGHGFVSVMLCIVMMTAAVYLPFFNAFADTNIFLLLLFLIAVMVGRRWTQSNRA